MITAKKNKGVSLIELLVYIAVLAGALSLVVTVLITVTGSYADVRAQQKLVTTGANVLERIIRDVRDADSIKTQASTFDTSPGVLAIDTLDAGQNPQTTLFFVQNGALSVITSGSPPQPLIGTDAVVDTLIFRRMQNASVSEGVKIEFTLSDSAGNMSENFYGTAVLRGSY